jgi:hypothetical protein
LKHVSSETKKIVTSNNGSFSSQVSSDDPVKDTPFFAQGAFGTEILKG